MHSELIPSEAEIFAWIEKIFAQGVRRPGYSADRWTENWCEQQFRLLGLESVRRQPVKLPQWEPLECSLLVQAQGSDWSVPCFPLPHSAPTQGLRVEIEAWSDDETRSLAGKAALVDVSLNRVPPAFTNLLLARREEFAGEDLAWRCYDPRRSFDDAVQVLPFGRHVMAVMEPAIAAGAVAFVGTLSNYPGGSFKYYVPYDAQPRPIPGVWISARDGERLRQLCRDERVRIMLVSRAVRREISTDNVIGELPGADDEIVVIGSHHDGPWSSAVEDASGVALVMAQAQYWSRVPAAARPHHLLFLLNAGHMAGGAGVRAFVDQQRALLERVVLEVHLEHAANEVIERDGELVCSGNPEPRWWFTSCSPHLETAVRDAITSEDLERSLIVPPDIFGPMPTTDGGPFHLAGVPLVNFLTAPFYLFDEMDTLDKIHRPSLVPITRAAVRIVESTLGLSAATVRAEMRRSADGG